MRLNDLTVKNLPHKAERYEIWDPTLPRFGVRIGTRRKTFIVNIGRRRKALGVYPHTSLQEAREKARKLLYAKYQPATSLKASDASDLYLQAILGQKRPATLAVYRLYLKRLPNEPLNALTAQKLYAALPEGKSAANLCFASFKAFLTWCVQRDYLTVNPLISRRQPNKLKSRDRLLTDDEVKAIWKESFNHPGFGTICRLLILTGQRLNQVATFQEAWVQESQQALVFPAFIMKSGIEHTIPLTPLVEKELTNLQPIKNINGHMVKFRAQLDIPHWTLHDFRRYLSSTMSRLEVPIDITETILAHTSGSRSDIQRTYDRDKRLPQMRAALTKYEAHLLSLVR